MVRCVVVIPIHSSEPSEYELISFAQCFKILGKHRIVVIAPSKLNINAYKKVINSFEVIYIPFKWQSNILNYNKLKLSQYFYSLFNEYEYLLTYELDAFVFKDELNEWCSKGYDYIGAPWLENYNPNSTNIVGVGNSGFSLRNINTIKKCLRSLNYYDSGQFNSGYRRKLLGFIKYPFYSILKYNFENYFIQNAYSFNEDIIISKVFGEKYNGFKLAPVNDAVKFSFELNPKYLYSYNNYQLPMGCHAWWRYDLSFWKPFIESYGYNIR